VLVCDRLAAEAGVSAGQKLSTALGLQPGLAVSERDAAREGGALESLACWAGRFTPTLSDMFERTSAVQQTTPPSGLMLASPVRMPTFSGPSSPQSAKNFSLASALIGLV
jgi:hypothetical protein